jgi:hypothetical protein
MDEATYNFALVTLPRIVFFAYVTYDMYSNTQTLIACNEIMK